MKFEGVYLVKKIGCWGVVVGIVTFKKVIVALKTRPFSFISPKTTYLGKYK